MIKNLFYLCLIMLGSAFFAACSPGSVPVVSSTGPQVATLVAQTLAALAPTATPLIAAATAVQPVSANSDQAASMQLATPTRAPSSLSTSPTPQPTTVPVILQTQTSPTTVPSQVLTPASPTSASAAKPDPACIDKAAFYGDVTIPDNTLLKMNTEFVKTWKIRNAGTCVWGDGYKLVFARGQILGGPPSSPLPSAAPGELIDVSVNLESPSQGGTYIGDWQFENPSGKRFGVNSGGVDFIFVIIRVDWGAGGGPSHTLPSAACDYSQNQAYEAQLLQLINNERQSRGLSPLALQNQLSAAATTHSADMACNSFLDHSGSDGSNYSQRVKAQGYAASYASENVYAGGTPQDAFMWWMNSPVHRDNLLSNKATQIGIGYAYSAKSRFGGYYTLVFGKPLP